MAYNFMKQDRDQGYLLPPNVREWLPQGDLAWFLLDVVAQMDLSAFYRGYREDGHGHPAFEPSMKVTLLLYAYCLGERSSRRIERLCQRDLGFRVVTVNQAPDHTTIARFRQEHQEELADLLKARYEVADVMYHRKPSASKPADPKVIARMGRECDYVIVAIGD